LEELRPDRCTVVWIMTEDRLTAVATTAYPKGAKGEGAGKTNPTVLQSGNFDGGEPGWLRAKVVLT
jgi:hypothetical protein